MNRLNWDEYFMANAKLAAARSQDPNTQVGAALVNDNKLISMGYNGFPRGLSGTWNKNEGLDNKAWYVCHAEFNAILNTINGAIVKGSTLYVTLFPCHECAKMLIQVGVKRVVYLSDKYHDQLSYQASRNMLTEAGISLEEYQGRKVNLFVEE